MVKSSKTVFISYRRSVSGEIAHAVRRYLEGHGYDVFMDVADGHGGHFDTMLLQEIAKRKHFVLILAPESVQRLEQEGDWLRREIERAIELDRNIVPLLTKDFDFGDPAVRSCLTGALSELWRYNGVKVDHDYFDESMERLREWLRQPGRPWTRRILGTVVALVVLVGLFLGIRQALHFWAEPTETPAVTTKRVSHTSTPTGSMLTATPEIFTREVDGAGMVYVDRDEFQMGNNSQDIQAALNLCQRYGGDCEEERKRLEAEPRHTVTLEAFWIDRYEVTNGQFAECVDAKACEPPTSCTYGSPPTYGTPSFEGHPVVCVSWENAKAYCEWAGARLPSEAEWEAAARGPSGRLFPWEGTFHGEWLNFCDENCEQEWKKAGDDGYPRTAPVGEYAEGASEYGAYNMAGNVYEWTNSVAMPYPYDPEDGRESADTAGERILRGGSWEDDPHNTRSTRRCQKPQDFSSYHLGFRCAVDATQ